jgi:hypothetical protein
LKTQSHGPKNTNWQTVVGYVFVKPSGAKLWLWRYRFDGIEKNMSFGDYLRLLLREVLQRQHSRHWLFSQRIHQWWHKQPERDGIMRREESISFDAGKLRTGLEVIANQLGKKLDEDNPLLHAQLPDGSRLAAVIPPVVRPSPALTIRKFTSRHPCWTKTVSQLSPGSTASRRRRTATLSGSCLPPMPAHPTGFNLAICATPIESLAFHLPSSSSITS